MKYTIPIYVIRALLLLVIPLCVMTWWTKDQSLRTEKGSEVGSRTRRDVLTFSREPVPVTFISLFGVSVETDPEIGGAIEFGPGGSMTLLEEMSINVVLYGLLENSTRVRFAMHEFSCEVDSDMDDPIDYSVTLDDDEHLAYGTVVGRVEGMILPKRADYPRVYFCLTSETSGGDWLPQGGSSGTHFTLKSPLLPIWIRILLLISLLSFSGLFSGLSLGLMSLDKTDLSIVINTGTEIERKYATKIAPVRNHGNFLLCSLLFSNVLVNVCATLMMDSLMSGVFAVVSSTFAIVVFGEIIPQSICSRHGLAVGAHTIFITKFFMALTSPLSWPLSLLLDKVLGEEIGAVYTRERLKELLVVTKNYHGLEKEEVALISGALGMKTKYVGDVMTPLTSVFMLSIDSNLDYTTLAEIEFQAYTRIPIFEKERQNIVAVLNVKQITLLDAGENIPIRSIVDYYTTSKEIFHVPFNTHLDQVFRDFRSGNKGNMVIVQETSNSEDAEGSSTQMTTSVGIVTMEDVLEELLQTKILDEKDIDKFRAQRKREISVSLPPKSSRKKDQSGRGITIPPPLALAACQFLTTSVRAFSRTEISDTVLHRLIKSTLTRATPPKSGEPDRFIYQAGVQAEAFVMIFEGTVEVLAGKENLSFPCGPFTCFGAEFLFAGEKSKELVVGGQKPVLKRDPSGTGFQRFSTQIRRQSIQLRRLSTVMAKPLPKPPIAFPKYAFIPDYSLRVISETFYISVDFRIYRAARGATHLEKKYKSDSKGAVGKPTWRREVEETLTAIEQDLKYKHRRRIICTEAEDFENEDLDMDMDVQLTTALFLPQSENTRREIHEFLSSVLK